MSVDAGGGAANGPSGGASISGDNRRARFVAFHSEASNLVGADANGGADVFVWSRPAGRAGLALADPARPAGSLVRASVGRGGTEANGPSRHPALDGGVRRAARCVAFESNASNLSRGDRDGLSDVFVRDLATGRTRLVSRRVRAPAGDATIDGSCRRVAFSANGRVLVARVRGGRPRVIGRGADPDLSLDGTALTWTRLGAVPAVLVRREGRTSTVTASGQNPRVSDEEFARWAVVFDTRANLTAGDQNPGQDVYLRTFGPRGGPRATDLISAPYRGGPSLGGDSANGGLSAYAGNRGIVTFANARDGHVVLYYRNNNSGRIDDLAHAPLTAAGPAIANVATSARANFVAFTSGAGTFRFAGAGRADVFFKHLAGGDAL